jgi:N-methylhydantoinase B
MDPVSFRILWSRLVGVAEEAAAALRHSAFSSIVSEGNDCTAVLFDATGRELAQPASYTATSFIGTLPRTVALLLERFPPAGWEPGDMLVCNDPWLGTGHLFDIIVVSPVFRDDRLAAFVATCSHTPHIGGNGGRVDSRSTFEEGLRLPPTWLHRRGEPVSAVFDILRANVPQPQQVLGDVAAQVSAHAVAARHIRTIMAEAELDSWDEFATRLHELCSSAMRRVIAEIPDGEYSHRFTTDGGHVELACRVAVRGERALVDFSGSSGEVANAINCPFHYTLARTFYGLKAMLLPSIPNNAATFEPVEVYAPPGSILNPQPPAPTAQRAVVGHFVPAVVMGALNHAVPGLAVADGAGASWFMDLAGARDGRPFHTHVSIGSGQGASVRGHGMDAVTYPGNAAGMPVELLERETSLIALAKELRRGSAGAGQHRGGLGQRVRLRVAGSDPVAVSVMGDRTREPASGFAGGGDGQVGALLVNGEARMTRTPMTLRPGDELEILTPGGGGYGTP